MTALAILDAAQDVLVEHGLHAPMELIAARAGVAVGTLYNHFSDRKSLVDALLDELRTQLSEHVLAAREATDTLPVREQLTAMLTAMFDSWSEIFLVIKQGELVPDAKKRSDIRKRVLDQFGPVIERGRKQGLFTDDPEGLHVYALQGLLQALFSYAADEPKKLSREQAVERVVDFFFSGASTRKVVR